MNTKSLWSVLRDMNFGNGMHTTRRSSEAEHVNVTADAWGRWRIAAWLQKLLARQSEQLDQHVLRKVVQEGRIVYKPSMWFRGWSRRVIDARGTYVVPYLRAAWPYVKAGRLPGELSCQMAMPKEQTPARVEIHGKWQHRLMWLKSPAFATGIITGLLVGIGATVAWNATTAGDKVRDRFDIVVVRQGYALKINKQTGETWVIQRTGYNQWAEEQTLPKRGVGAR